MRSHELPKELIDAVLSRLALSHPRVPDVSWLAEAYRAWAQRVPFANLSKLDALRRGAPLPSLEPGHLLAHFLESGEGGTCFGQALAFRALLSAVGYEARNCAGETLGDDGVRGEHATTLVHLDGATYLVDTALPHGLPLALFRDRSSQIDGVMTPMTATPADDLWRLDFEIRHNKDRRHALLTQPLDSVEAAHRRWLRSLEDPKNPFNLLPVVRLETPKGSLTLAGKKLFWVDLEGRVEVEPAGPEALARFGIEAARYAHLWQRPVPQPTDG